MIDTPLPIETTAPAEPPSDGGFVAGLTAKLAAAYGDNPDAEIVEPVIPDAPVVKELEVPAEKTPDDLLREADEGIEKNKMPRAAQWQLMKEQRAADRARADAAVAELEKLKSAAPPEDVAAKAELETLRAKVKAQEDRIKAVDVVSSEEFQNLVNAPAKQIYADVSSLAARNEIKVDEVWAALTEPDVKARNAKLSDIAGGLNMVEQQEMFNLARELQQLSDTRERLLADSGKAHAELEARRVRQAAETKQKAQADWSSSADEVWSAVTTHIKDLPAELRDTLKSIDPSAIPTRHQAYNALAGHALPVLLKAQAAAAKELAETKTALAKLQKASPGTPAARSEAPGSGDVAEGGFMENLMRRLKTEA